MKRKTHFSKTEPPTLTLDQVAEELGVSTASVRNWVKAGYLVTMPDRTICHLSFNTFRSDIAGVEKLTKRANKSLADDHDHKDLQDKVSEELKSGLMTGDNQSDRYEISLSNSYKNKEGIYYTPLAIAKTFFDALPKDRSKLTFCDPCCGTGNFLLAALESGIKLENIFGFDTDQTAVEIARSRILEKTGQTATQLCVSDFMDVISLDITMRPKFDVIFTNPPWGKKLPKSEKMALSKRFCTGTSVDTCSIFFFASLEVIAKDGYLGMLLPDAFFNVATFKDARLKALSQRVISMEDYGRPFQGLITKAKSIIIQNKKIDKKNMVSCKSKIGIHTRTQKSFSTNPKARLNFPLLQIEHNVIKHVLGKPHCTLENRARWGLGIVTGNNKRFISRTGGRGYIPVLKGRDIYSDRVSEPVSFIPDDLSLYQQVAPRDIYEAKEKLIYRFISSKLVFFHDTKQRYLLNSANALVPDDEFPVSGQVLSNFLSSNFINWFFTSLFETHKVLRSDIECLPIFHEHLTGMCEFDEYELLNYLGIKENKNGSYRIKA